MGAFHVVLNFFAVVGNRFGSAGLRDILIEVNVLASVSVDAVLEGGTTTEDYESTNWFQRHWDG